MSKGLVLVVGCTGFVGSQVTKALLKRGFSVRGACRNTGEARETFADSWICRTDQSLELAELSFPVDGTPVADEVLDKLVEDVVGVFMCAGHENQEPATIDFMVNAALSILKAAKKAKNNITVVLTSSTGSTNLPEAAAGALKNETDFWSDPAKQQAAGKYSPAAKTLMEIKALEFVGRNKENQIVDQAEASSAPRLCIINPSLILGRRLQPGELKGNGLPWFARIIKGEAMTKEIPNDSMSIISVSDLALLHVACLEDTTASGRYFGVVQSWCWEDILSAVKKQVPEYQIPQKNFSDSKPVTKFDNSRRDALLLAAFGEEFKLKDLDAILEETIDYLKESGNI
eukprot:GFUD01025614.1.p1 GENE.GFUD01025614.1~~GFUD01025614.1.p1  ORF type:complete len:344 (-),score=111.90 GFUD01025614.1:127-1158(-)